MELMVSGNIVKLDPDYYNLFKDKNIYLNHKGYAMMKKQSLHRIITECPKDKVVDHINQNKLDNRSENLRICSVAENNINRPLSQTSKTGLTGVHFYKPLSKYVAYISRDKKRHHLGYFDSKEEAYYKYCAVAKILHGEFTADRIKNIKVEPCEIKPKEYKSPQYVLDYYQNNKEAKSRKSLIKLNKKNGKRPKDITIDKHQLTEDEIAECLEIYNNK